MRSFARARALEAPRTRSPGHTTAALGMTSRPAVAADVSMSDAGAADARSCASPPPSGLASWDVHECSPETNELARVLLCKWLKHHEATSRKVGPPYSPTPASWRAERERPWTVSLVFLLSVEERDRKEETRRALDRNKEQPLPAAHSRSHALPCRPHALWHPWRLQHDLSIQQQSPAGLAPGGVQCRGVRASARGARSYCARHWSCCCAAARACWAWVLRWRRRRDVCRRRRRMHAGWAPAAHPAVGAVLRSTRPG